MNLAQINFQETIQKRRDFLADYLRQSMGDLAESCAQVWNELEALNNVLRLAIQDCDDGFSCDLIYAIDPKGIQISSNHGQEKEDLTVVGQNLSARPYFKKFDHNMFVSDVYVNHHNLRSCVTVVHEVKKENNVLGYVIADFPLRTLPESDLSTSDRRMWLQVQGDPSIRGTLFMQTRTHSAMDKDLIDVMNIMEELILERGIFHAKLHYSSSRGTLWLFEDPYRYRVHVLDEILHAVCLAYPRRAYPQEAIVSQEQVREVFRLFRVLREADETVYLRASSLNIINGQVALNFSCDGSHYMPVEEFLEKDSDFWFGEVNG